MPARAVITGCIHRLNPEEVRSSIARRLGLDVVELRDVRELLERGLMVKNPGGGRSTSYRLADLDETPG